MPELPHAKIRPVFRDPPTKVADCDVDYAELAVTTNFSFLRGASHPRELVYTAANLGYRAIAVTDRNTLAGMVRAHEAAEKCGMKLIVGARLELVDGPEVLVWVENREGYANLCRLLTAGKKLAKKGECTLCVKDVVQRTQGLWAGVVEGTVGQKTADSGQWQGMRIAKDPIRMLKEAFGDRLSLAISAAHGPDDQELLAEAERTARGYGLPLLATNDVHYHDPGRRRLQDVLTCARHGCTIAEAGYKLFANAERHLKQPDEMARLFANHPGAIQRAMEVGKRCSSFKITELTYEYPREFVPAGITAGEHLENLTKDGAKRRYPEGVPDKVRAQIEEELALIRDLKYEPYFLTIYDLVEYARSKGILCQGRGSAAN